MHINAKICNFDLAIQFPQKSFLRLFVLTQTTRQRGSLAFYWSFLIWFPTFISDGFLLIAIVLPFTPYVERGGTGVNKPLSDVSHFQCRKGKYPDQVKCFVEAVERWFVLIFAIMKNNSLFLKFLEFYNRLFRY